MSKVHISDYAIKIATTDTDILDIKRVDDLAFAGCRGITMEELYKVKELGVLLILHHKATGKVVGEAQFLFQPIPEIPHHFVSPVGYCYGIAVRPEVRTHGLGKVLMQHIWTIAVAGGVEEIHLSVRVENYPSLRLMFGQGYRIIEYRSDFYGPNKKEGPRLIMSKRGGKQQRYGRHHTVEVPTFGLFDENVHAEIAKHLSTGRVGIGINSEGFIFA